MLGLATLREDYIILKFIVVTTAGIKIWVVPEDIICIKKVSSNHDGSIVRELNRWRVVPGSNSSQQFTVRTGLLFLKYLIYCLSIF